MQPTVTVSDLLGSRGRVLVLRVLSGLEVPVITADVARRTRLTHPAASQILREFSGMGIVGEAPAGRGHTYWLLRDNVHVREIVLPLFEAEQRLLGADSAQPRDRSADRRLNRSVRPYLAAVEDACRRHHVVSSAVFGSATQTERNVVPKDLDLLVTFAPLEPKMKAQEYAALVAELEEIMGMPVDVMVSTGVRNPYLADEIERTKVVLYEVA